MFKNVCLQVMVYMSFCCEMFNDFVLSKRKNNIYIVTGFFFFFLQSSISQYLGNFF